ncbi:5'-3' exoribonuclease 2 [Dimargaris cristalligena]|nr:5'-3' exoribonuclease 2 [Dimargaris cristalligena]
MGVPSFFLWLSRKFPKILMDVPEEGSWKLNGVEVPVDLTQPPLTGRHCDNLYLDMNGIIHPCCHPENKPAPATEELMILDIFSYIDRVFSMIRPRKILYMAIDGVAPRAKMNQQRSRRFRSAQESAEFAAEKEELSRELGLPPLVESGDKFDSNVITPGTPFMARLAAALRYYVAERMNSDPAWAGLQVIITDATVPGEGEHKIMDFIRSQRASPDYNPDTYHVLHGLDADLIMLALATHEPHFTILREKTMNKWQASKQPPNDGEDAADETGLVKSRREATDAGFCLLKIDVLREYLNIELSCSKIPLPKFELESAIDDWIFLCFFVGNDFLPHLPGLDIQQGTLEDLVDIWQDIFARRGTFMTRGSQVNLEFVQEILNHIASTEQAVLVRMYQEAKKKLQRSLRDDDREKATRIAKVTKKLKDAAGQTDSAKAAEGPQAPPTKQPRPLDNKSAAQTLRASLQHALGANSETGPEDVPPNDLKRKAAELEAESPVPNPESGDLPIPAPATEADLPTPASANDPSAPAHSAMPAQKKTAFDPNAEVERKLAELDNAQLHEPGYRERYYRVKFGVEGDDLPAFVAQITKSYIEGLCWVLRYYYSGCPSWTWYFPYHYAPFASDFKDIAKMDIQFDIGRPFKPMEQLMGVFPAASRSCLPPAFANLMVDPKSPILDFYPLDFKLDMNGKSKIWKAVALLPFIDEKRLLEAMKPLEDTLSDDEKIRNSLNEPRLLVGPQNALHSALYDLYSRPADDQNASLAIEPVTSMPLSGVVQRDEDFVPETTFYSPFGPETEKSDIPNDKSISAIFRLPKQPEGSTPLLHLHPKVNLPPKTLPNFIRDLWAMAKITSIPVTLPAVPVQISRDTPNGPTLQISIPQRAPALTTPRTKMPGVDLDPGRIPTTSTISTRNNRLITMVRLIGILTPVAQIYLIMVVTHTARWLHPADLSSIVHMPRIATPAGVTPAIITEGRLAPGPARPVVDQTKFRGIPPFGN